MFRLKSWWKRKYDGYANTQKQLKKSQVAGEGLSEVHCCTCTHAQLWCQIVHHHCRVCHPYLVEAISENCMELSCYVKGDCFADRLLTFPLYQPGVIVWDNHWESAKSGISLFIHRFSSTYPFNFWKLEPISAVTGQRQGAGSQSVTGPTQRDRQPFVNKFTHNRCNCMPLGCGMQLEYPWRTYKLHTERLQLDGGFELTFLPFNYPNKHVICFELNTALLSVCLIVFVIAPESVLPRD